MTRRWRTLDARPTRVIAHRGASGPLPEHTLAGYALAAEQGADVLEPDLVPSRDGVLMVRHDRGLARSTDIASRPDFAALRVGDDWPVERIDRDALRLLRAVQPFPQRDPSHDGRHPLFDFGELLAWADALAAGRGRRVVLYPELKHPAEFAAAGLDPLLPLQHALRDVDRSRIEIWVQCFDAATLRRVRAAARVPVFLLLDRDADWREALDRHGGEVDGFGASKALLADAAGRDSGFVAHAHAQGLAIHAWTYRDDVLPAGVASVESELAFAFDLGVDAVFCDFPATGVAARERWALGRATRQRGAPPPP